MAEKRLFDLTFPVSNAAGWCKDLNEVQELARSPVAGIVVGSVTVEPREGNPGRTFDMTGPWALNSIGLKNRGLGYYREYGPQMVKVANDAGKLIIKNGAGFSPKQYGVLADAASEIGFDGFEINLGCPNVVDGGKRHRIASFDPALARLILEEVFAKANTFVTVKVSPMTDPEGIRALAEVIEEYPVKAVVTMNAIPNGLLFDDQGNSMIETPDTTGWAGISGPCVKPFALGQVSQWRKALPHEIEVWGVGGVTFGRDVRDMILAGAAAVQVGTAYFTKGAKFFGDLATEYINL